MNIIREENKGVLLELKEAKQLDFWADVIPARKIFILVSGRAGVGKSLVANLIVNSLRDKGFKATQEGFADAVKDAAIDYFGWNGEKDSSGRKLLQQIGNVGREYSKDTWVSQFVDKHAYDYSNGVVVVSDWRFPNELEYIEDSGFQILTIRVNAPERESLKGTEYYNDISETSLLDSDPELYDYYIDNDQSLTIEILKKEIENFIERYF